MVGASWRPEFPQEFGNVRGQLVEREVGGIASLPPAEGVEDEKRLVRVALVALLPDAQVVEAGQEGISVRPGVHSVYLPGRKGGIE